MKREHVLPAATLGSLLAIWGFVVYVFEVPEYIVPSPLHVARTFIRDFDTIIRNVVPTAIESFLGFFVGNLASIVIATVFVHQKTVEQALFPLARDDGGAPYPAREGSGLRRFSPAAGTTRRPGDRRGSRGVS